MFCAMLFYSTVVYFLYEFIEEWERADFFWMTVINIPYTIVPIILTLRLWKERPFDEKQRIE